jgi:hypothetical protein
MGLLSHTAMLGTAKVLEFGAKKYSADGWREGMEWRRLIGAAYRHLGAFQDGQDYDEETGLCHLHHLSCCVMFLQEYFEKGMGTDDRFVREKPVKMFGGVPCHPHPIDYTATRGVEMRGAPMRDEAGER